MDEFDTIKLGIGRWAIVQNSFPSDVSPRNLELALSNTTGVVLSPIDSQNLGPYLVMHVPDIRVDEPENIEYGYILLKDPKGSRDSVPLGEALNIYRERLSRGRPMPLLGAFIFSGNSRGGNIDEVLLDYFRHNHEVVEALLRDPHWLILEPHLGALTALPMVHGNTPEFYEIGSRHSLSGGLSDAVRGAGSISLSRQPYH